MIVGSRRRALGARLIAAALLLLAAFVSPTTVVCQGADRHEAVESIFGGCDRPEAASSPTPGPVVSAHPAHAGCEDTPLLSNAAPVRGAPHDAAPLAVVADRVPAAAASRVVCGVAAAPKPRSVETTATVLLI